jgi:hypothetical protein
VYEGTYELKERWVKKLMNGRTDGFLMNLRMSQKTDE